MTCALIVCHMRMRLCQWRPWMDGICRLVLRFGAFLSFAGVTYRVGGLALSLAMGNRSGGGITYETIILSFA